MDETMAAMVEMVSDGDFAVRVSSDPRLVTVGEMLEAAALLNEEKAV